jgi:hypothetical protein
MHNRRPAMALVFISKVRSETPLRNVLGHNVPCHQRRDFIKGAMKSQAPVTRLPRHAT